VKFHFVLAAGIAASLAAPLAAQAQGVPGGIAHGVDVGAHTAGPIGAVVGGAVGGVIGGVEGVLGIQPQPTYAAYPDGPPRLYHRRRLMRHSYHHTRHSHTTG